MAMKIVQAECMSCGDCEPVCPTHSITERDGIYRINQNTCSECADQEIPQCLSVCPAGEVCIVYA